MCPPDDLRGDLDLVHVLVEGVSRLLTDDFQKHFLEKENKVSKCWAVPVGALYSRGQSSRPSHHFLSSGARENRLRPLEMKASHPQSLTCHSSKLKAGLLTLSVEAVVRDADVNKALQDLRRNNPKLEGKRRFISSGFSWFWDNEGNKSLDIHGIVKIFKALYCKFP